MSRANVQVTARMPEALVGEIDRAAEQLKRTRAELIRQAVEYYLEDLEDLTLGLQRLQDRSDPVLDWEEVEGVLVGLEEGDRPSDKTLVGQELLELYDAHGPFLDEEGLKIVEEMQSEQAPSEVSEEP